MSSASLRAQFIDLAQKIDRTEIHYRDFEDPLIFICDGVIDNAVFAAMNPNVNDPQVRFAFYNNFTRPLLYRRDFETNKHYSVKDPFDDVLVIDEVVLEFFPLLGMHCQNIKTRGMDVSVTRHNPYISDVYREYFGMPPYTKREPRTIEPGSIYDIAAKYAKQYRLEQREKFASDVFSLIVFHCDEFFTTA